MTELRKSSFAKFIWGERWKFNLFTGSSADLVDYLDDCFEINQGKIVITINSFTASQFQDLIPFLSKEVIFTIDGRPILWLFRFLLNEGKMKLTPGSELGTSIIETSRNSRRFLVIGGSENSNSKTVYKIGTNYHFAIGDYSKLSNHQEQDLTEYYQRIIHENHIDTVICCLGQPKQELLATSLFRLMPNLTILCLGAWVDFYSGTSIRAPKSINKIGLEWLWRLIFEPKRLAARYIIYSPKGLIATMKHVKRDKKYFSDNL